MPLFGRRREAKSARKWHDSVAATVGESRPSPTTNYLQGHEFHLFPYAQLSTNTKHYLGKKKRSEAEQDQALIDLIQHDQCKEVAFAACLEFLSLGAAQSLLDNSFYVGPNASYGLENYLQAFVALAHCKPTQDLDQDRLFVQSLIPAVHAVSNHGVNPTSARELLTAWSINEPINRLLLVRATEFTKQTFRQINSELGQFQASLALGKINRSALDRVFEYSTAFAAHVEPDDIISSCVTNWRSWATWAPNIWRLRVWAALPPNPNGSTLHYLMELDGPDFSVDETRSNKWSSLMHTGQLLQWLESKGFALGLGVITGDSAELLAEFIHSFIDCAQSSLRKGKSDFFRYLITKHGVDSQALRCWQVADALLDSAFVALLLCQHGPCHEDSDDDKALISGLKSLARDITQAVREPLGKDIAVMARACVDDLLAIVQRCSAMGEDWIEPAMRLWALRSSIATSGWLHSALDSILVFSCTSQSPLHGLNTLHALRYGIEKVLNGSQTTLKSCFDIYVQSFLFTGGCVETETTAVPYVLHSTWMHVQRDTVREVAVKIACSENLETSHRISCIKRLSTISEDDLSVLLQSFSFVKLPHGNILAIRSLLLVIDVLQTSAGPDPCWKELFIYLTKNADLRIDREEFTALGFSPYRQFLEALHDVAGNDIELVQSAHQWLEELRSVETVLATIEADWDSFPAMHCILAEQTPEIRMRYLKMLQCLEKQSEPEKKLLLHELVLALRSWNSADVCHAIMAISKVESRGFAQCEELLMTCREDRDVASVRLSFWLKSGGLSDAAEAALTSLGRILNLGLDNDLDPPSSSFDAAKKEYAKRVAELVARAQQLEKIQRSLRRSDANSIDAMIAALGLEAPLSGIATLTADLPTSLASVVNEVSDDEVELRFLVSKELEPLEHLAFGLKGTETLTVHLQLDDQGKFGCFCVHLHDRAVKPIQNHNYYNSASAPDRLYCGNERLTRLTYAVSRNLWTAASQQGETSLQAIYEGIRSLMQTGARRCMVCGNSVGAQLHRATICNNANCRQALLKTPLDLRLQDVRSNGRVVDLLLTSVFAAANVSNLALLPGCPATLNDASKLQILLNSLPPIATLAAAKDFQTVLQGCGLRAQLLMSWLCTSYRGFIVPATGSYQLPNMPRIHQFLVVNNTPEIEAAFAVHNHHQPRHVLFHGTSIDRLYAILVQGLKICSHTPLQKHGAASGAGIYTGREPKTALSYATATQNNANINNFFISRPDFCNSTILLGLEHAGDHGGRGGVHVITDPTRILLRYIFVVPPSTTAPKAADIVPAMLMSFQRLKDAATSRAVASADVVLRGEGCGFM